MTPATARRIAATMGFLAVAFGAFGAHGMKNLLARNGTADIWEKAVFYHFIHAVMLFVLAERDKLPKLAWNCFLAGIAIFSGSLYLLAATDWRWLGAVTPAADCACWAAGWPWRWAKGEPVEMWGNFRGICDSFDTQMKLHRRPTRLIFLYKIQLSHLSLPASAA